MKKNYLNLLFSTNRSFHAKKKKKEERISVYLSLTAGNEASIYSRHPSPDRDTANSLGTWAIEKKKKKINRETQKQNEKTKIQRVPLNKKKK